MTLALDVRHSQSAFTLAAKLEAGRGVLALFGASGSGKTTLINIVAGLIKPTEGQVSLDGLSLTDTRAGIHVPAHRRRMGYVFQDGLLFPHLNVQQNLTYGRWFATGRASADNHFAQVVALLGLDMLLGRAPKTLSGGEKQRVAIGRALLSSPRLLIMDEPLAALDQPRKDEILPYLERLRDESQVPIVYVSHSAVEVARLASQVAILDAGRLTAFGPVSEVLQHAELLPLGERGEASSVIEAVVSDAAAGHGIALVRSAGNTWQIPAVGLANGNKLRLRVRGRDVMIALSPPKDISALNSLPGRITEIRAAGLGATDVALDCAGDRLVARLTPVSVERLKLAVGQVVHAVVKAVAFDRS